MYKFMMGQMFKNDPRLIFDWNRAARLILESDPQEIWAGLKEDWIATAGPIFQNGKPTPKEETYTYLASVWATPAIEIDGKLIDCYVEEEECAEGWDAATYWPESALEILKAKQS